MQKFKARRLTKEATTIRFAMASCFPKDGLCGRLSVCQQLGQNRNVGDFFESKRERNRIIDLAGTQWFDRVDRHAAKTLCKFLRRDGIVWIAFRIFDSLSKDLAISRDDL